MPSMRPPSDTRKRQRSWTCGSLAAFAITVSPRASTAAMTAFSVPVTDASSRKIERPARSRRLHLVAPADLDGRAQPLERVHVRVEPPAADHVPSGRRNHGAPAAREQRACEEDRRPDPAAELLVELVPGRVGRMDPQLAGPEALDVDADVGHELEHRLDVEDARDVRERHGLVREQAGSDDRQRRVLVAGRPNPAAQRDGRRR